MRSGLHPMVMYLTEKIMGCEAELVMAKEIAEEVFKLLKSNITTGLHCCPVCDGRGVVRQGFYEDCRATILCPNNQETCRACAGVGYLELTT